MSRFAKIVRQVCRVRCPQQRRRGRLCGIAVAMLALLVVSSVTASPESPTSTPKPTPAANAKQGAKPTPKGIALSSRLAPAGEPIYASRPVPQQRRTTRASAVPRLIPPSPGSDWGTAVFMWNGQWVRTPVYYGVYRQKERIGLEQQRRGEDKVTPEQRRLWQRMDRPWGTPWRSFSTPDEHGYPNN